ncbi:unnamed protein product [Cyclocybe aegerita]|uniref:HIT-type domain-containing protein n=1 Tax=Cyclocybe aegerita TaxID=1973307 RepID=A0A8S0VUB2_CYCAE|nr:unnamed protein product [Cyclocybe aegerita]
MAPKSKKPVQCEVCSEQNYKYTCPRCGIIYCSLGCYKKHKESSYSENNSKAPLSTANAPVNNEALVRIDEAALADPTPLRPLTSLKWPYVPEESAFPDPLKRDDPKTLQLPQYEAIATSPAIRRILSQQKNLPELLTNIDKLRGPDRDAAIQRALGVTAPEIDNQLHRQELSEEVLAFRELAEAIEAAVRGGNEAALGLNWGD